MNKLIEIRNQELMCRERALLNSERRAFWLAKAEEWGQRALDEIAFHFRGPRIIATDRQAPRIYPRMIRLCSRFDSVLFTPKISEIPSYGNYSRSPLG
jgi:hypothetical protein